MCACNPVIKTPYCGRPGCEWPKPGNQKFEKFFKALVARGYYGRVAFMMKKGEVVGSVETYETHKIDDNLT